MSSPNLAEEKREFRNTAREILLFYFLMCIGDGIVPFLLGVPIGLHSYFNQLTSSEIFEILLADLAVSIVTTPAAMWVAGAMIRNRYRKEVL